MADQIPLEAPDKEALVNRNPHGDFAAVEASRPPYSHAAVWTATKSPNPAWAPGGGSLPPYTPSPMVHIDPYEAGRKDVQNYKLMISTTVPRPIALVSTVSVDGKSSNLAPFSYFQNVCSDPPLYSLCFAGEVEVDSHKNLVGTGECCISIVGDWFIEAANYTSTNAPLGTSEFALAGLHALPSTLVKPTYVAESAFSIECKLVSKQEILSPTTGVRSAMLCTVEAVQFHVREDALVGGRDGERSTVDMEKLRPVWRGGGITYGTAVSGYEILRPKAFRVDREKEGVKELIKDKVEGQ